MINLFTLAKVLLDRLTEVTTANSYTLVPAGSEYTRDASATFVEEHVLFGKDDTVGLSADSSDIQFGVYQVDINVPKSLPGAKWRALEMANIIRAHFPKAFILTNGGQEVKIYNSSISKLDSDETHYRYILSITYSAIN